MLFLKTAINIYELIKAQNAKPTNIINKIVKGKIISILINIKLTIVIMRLYGKYLIERINASLTVSLMVLLDLDKIGKI